MQNFVHFICFDLFCSQAILTHIRHIEVDIDSVNKSNIACVIPPVVAYLKFPFKFLAPSSNFDNFNSSVNTGLLVNVSTPIIIAS